VWVCVCIQLGYVREITPSLAWVLVCVWESMCGRNLAAQSHTQPGGLCQTLPYASQTTHTHTHKHTDKHTITHARNTHTHAHTHTPTHTHFFEPPRIVCVSKCDASFLQGRIFPPKSLHTHTHTQVGECVYGHASHTHTHTHIHIPGEQATIYPCSRTHTHTHTTHHTHNTHTHTTHTP